MCPLRSGGKSKPEGAPYKVEGVGQDKIPGTLDLALVDEYISVSDRDAFTMANHPSYRLAIELGSCAARGAQPPTT